MAVNILYVNSNEDYEYLLKDKINELNKVYSLSLTGSRLFDVYNKLIRDKSYDIIIFNLDNVDFSDAAEAVRICRRIKPGISCVAETKGLGFYEDDFLKYFDETSNCLFRSSNLESLLKKRKLITNLTNLDDFS